MSTFFQHFTADIAHGASIGEDTRIWQHSIILAGAVIGARCNISAFCFVEDNVVLGNDVTVKTHVSLWSGVRAEDHVFIGPNVVFTNDLHPRSHIEGVEFVLQYTHLKYGCSLGANSTILCGTTIGNFALVGAGAVVTKDVPNHALVVGNPARIVGYVCICAKKLPIYDLVSVNAQSSDQIIECSCGRRYHVLNGALAAIGTTTA
jgi:UDP-2-acetamido-3-amino-2,3-dideoxy-glucuronate N-acetyltransferase